MASGSFISLPLLWTMLVNKVSGSYKVGFAVALEVGLGNVGGIISAWVFRGRDAPGYETGYRTILGMSCAAIVLLIVYATGLWSENKASEAGKRDYLLDEVDFDNLGDDHPRFRYGY